MLAKHFCVFPTADSMVLDVVHSEAVVLLLLINC